ncbi:MAG TPA: oligosaccharide flippase family protein [Luteolibacter sp.]|nr:oligosaccharide flippase family protein [Luteolibacter sp.]
MLSTAVIEEMPESAKRANSVRRDRSIRLAVVTSLVSKVGSVLLQLLSIPLAVRVLGREEFGLYTLVSLTLGTVSLLEIGVGPALTHGLSKARATHDDDAVRRLSSTSFFVMLVMAFAVASLMALIISTIPYPTLFGEKFAGKEHVLRPALWTGLGLFVSVFVLNLTERIREGYLEVATTNLWGAAGNLMGAVFVGAGIWFFHDVWFLILAIQGAMVLSKIGNTVACWRKHPLTAPSLKSFDGSLVKGLLTDGLSFTACFALSGLVEMNFCGWMIGRFGGGPSEVALFGVFMTLTVMQLGFVVMLSTPTWPAVAEALARGDMAWARGAARRLYFFGTGFAALASLGLVIVGPWAMGMWLGKSFEGTDRGILACYALYFLAHVWRHLNHAMMIGTGQVKRLAVIQIFETALMIPVVFIALRFGGLGAMLLAMTTAIAVTTGWILPRRVHRVLAEGS